MTIKEINDDDLGFVTGGTSNGLPLDVCSHCGNDKFDTIELKGGRGTIYVCTVCHLGKSGNNGTN